MSIEEDISDLQQRVTALENTPKPTKGEKGEKGEKGDKGETQPPAPIITPVIPLQRSPYRELKR
jgi:hypothetical protein